MAKLEYGDVSAGLMNEETGDWWPIAEVLKLHPFTGVHGCMNRADPVNMVGLSRTGKNAPDLVISNTQISNPGHTPKT